MPVSVEQHQVHVRPSPSGRWLVETSDGGDATTHATVNAAEREARCRLAAMGGGRMLVHDRYHRVRALHIGGAR